MFNATYLTFKLLLFRNLPRVDMASFVSDLDLWSILRTVVIVSRSTACPARFNSHVSISVFLSPLTNISADFLKDIIPIHL